VQRLQLVIECCEVRRSEAQTVAVEPDQVAQEASLAG
jgi:hypothetical protein